MSKSQPLVKSGKGIAAHVNKSVPKYNTAQRTKNDPIKKWNAPKRKS